MLVIKNNMDYQQLGPSVGYAVPQERSDVYMTTRNDVPQPVFLNYVAAVLILK